MTIYPSLKAEICGYTKNIDSVDYNQKLSQCRADVVEDVLVNKYRILGTHIIAKRKERFTTIWGVCLETS